MTIQNGTWIFVWATNKKLYMLNEEQEQDGNTRRKMGHATFFCGRPVLFAGEMGVVVGSSNNNNNTVAEWVKDTSGHYKPKRRHMRNFLLWLQDEIGVNVTTIEWRHKEDVLSIDDILSTVDID
jgi:hypothetical protein